MNLPSHKLCKKKLCLVALCINHMRCFNIPRLKSYMFSTSASGLCGLCRKKKPLALFPFNEILFFNTHGGQLFHLNILQGNYHRTIQVDSNQVELGLSLDVLPFEGQSGLLRLLLIISLKQFETYC